MSHSLTPSVGENITNVCHTQKCKDIAQSILDYVDFNIDPCSDFYQYTCGNWLKNATIPDDRSSSGTFDTASDKILDVLRSILEGSYEDVYKELRNGDEGFHTEEEETTDRANFDRMTKYYNMCMDTVTIDKLGPTPIYPEISYIENSLFPVQDSDEVYSSDKVKQLTDILLFQGLRDKNTLYSTGVGTDDKNPDKSIIVVSQAVLTLQSKEYYEKPETLEKYKSGLIKMLSSVISKSQIENQHPEFVEKSKKYRFQLWSTEKIKDAVDNFVTFEIALANISLKSVEMHDPIALYNPISLDEFQEQNPLINWNSIFKSLVQPTIPLPDKIIDRTPSYYKKLNSFLSSGIKMKTLQEYFVIKHIIHYINMLDSESRATYRKLVGSIISGTSVEQPRWRTCTSYTSDVFQELLGRYYVLKSFGSDEDRKKSETFMDAIYKAWMSKLPDADWLDAETRKKAIEKLNSIKYKVAYSTISPDTRSPKSLAKYYDGLTLNETSYFSSEIEIMTWGTKKAWKDIGKPVDKDEWSLSPQTVNAYYSRTNNEIAVPAGILQAPFYDTEYQDFLNYGGIGSIIGHELSHAFDDSGRKYDSHGNLVNWWTNSTTEAFDKKSKCFDDQYSKFNITGSDGNVVNINGKLTLGENIADNGGLSAALLAYEKLRPNHEKSEQRLAGLEKFSVEQLFFINFGKIWCQLQRPEYGLKLILSDSHSPSAARVNGVMQNSVEFSKAFSCPIGSKMNPTDKCNIW